MRRVILMLLVSGMVAVESRGEPKLLMDVKFENYSLSADYSGGDPIPEIGGDFNFKPGFLGSAAHFEKKNYLRFKVPGNYAPDAGTIEMRFKLLPVTDGNYNRHLVTVYTDESERFYLRQIAEDSFMTVCFGSKGGGSTSFPFSDNPEGSWHHIAFCWEGDPVEKKTRIVIYLDGQKKIDEYQPMLMPDFENEKSRICIGSYYRGESTFNGLIDDFKIYDGPVYTQESYPDLFIYPLATKLEKRLLQIGEGVELIPDAEVKQESQQRYAELEARVNALKDGKVKEEAYFEEYALVDEELHRLWETSAAPALWWMGRDAKDFEVLPVSCMRKVSERWSNAPSEPELPELASCGHEWSAFQLVVFPRFKDVADCTVKMEGLAGEDGEIAAANVKIFKVGTVMQEGDPKNAWADPIFPLEGSFTVPAETIQALWIQIYVPEGTAPGEYKGRIAVSTGDRTEEIPVSVWVRDFTLPIKPRLQTAFGFAMSPAATYYRNEDYRPIAKKYLENMLEHKVSIKTLWLHGIYHDTLFLAPKIIKTRTGEWKMDFADYDRQLDELLPLGLNTIMVGYRSWDGNFRSVKDKSKAVRHFPYFDEADIHRAKKLELPVLSPKTEKFGKWVIKTWYGHLKARGLENMAYTYFVDEPNHQMMGMVNTICGWSHDVAPDLENMITAAPSASSPNVDIWCPLTVNSNVLNYERSGGTIWKYVCCGPLGPSPNFFINQSALENRLPLWEGYKAGAKGFAYYEIGRSLYFENDGDNVWPLRWQNSTGTEGDGFFVYPGEDGPINTIRFEYIRMGIQDVEYFLMLKDLLKNLPAEHPLRAQAEALLVVDDSLMDGFGANYNTDWQIFERRKRHVGQMIELLKKPRQRGNNDETQ